MDTHLIGLLAWLIKKKVTECHAEFVFQVEIKRFIVGFDLIVCYSFDLDTGQLWVLRFLLENDL